MNDFDMHKAESRAGWKTVVVTVGIFVVCAVLGGLLSGKLF